MKNAKYDEKCKVKDGKMKTKMKARKIVPIFTLFLFLLPFFSPAAAQTEGLDKRIEIRCDFPAQ
ncbi:MAG: hypothetical protein ACNYVW_10340, partial [Methanosarcinales archaeon]